MAGTKRKLLGEKLVEKGLLTPGQLAEALGVQVMTGEPLGRVLVNLGFITGADLGKVLGSWDTTPAEGISEEVLKYIPEQFIRRHKLFPVKREGSRLFVTMADPLDIVAIDDLRLLTGLDIEPLAAGEKQINALIERYFGLPEVDRAMRDLGIVREEEEPYEAEDAADEAPVIRLVNSLIIKAIDEEASDVHIEPCKEGVLVRYRVDGLLREIMKLPRKMHHALVSCLKVMANMDIAQRRLPQDGRIQLKLQGRDLDLRVSTMPTIFGEKVVIRVLYKDSIKRYTMEGLGFSRYNLERFNALLQGSCGMVLVTGPTGSGKTTTLYAALDKLNSPEKNIITVEDPVEYLLAGVNQTQINVKAGITFATYLRSILRQDPDIIMIGEIRDRETAEISVRAAATGHLVLSTLHTNDAPGALNRLVDMGIEPFMAASSVIGVVSQRLVRRICTNCRREAHPDEFEQAFSGLQPGQTVYRGLGCEHCCDTGYRGRVALYEVLIVTSSLQKLILGRASAGEVKEAAVRGGMITLKEDGIQKSLAGLTTIREVARASYRE